MDDRLPERFDEVLRTVVALADPMIANDGSALVWIAANRAWTPGRR